MNMRRLEANANNPVSNGIYFQHSILPNDTEPESGFYFSEIFGYSETWKLLLERFSYPVKIKITFAEE